MHGRRQTPTRMRTRLHERAAADPFAFMSALVIVGLVVLVGSVLLSSRNTDDIREPCKTCGRERPAFPASDRCDECVIDGRTENDDD